MGNKEQTMGRRKIFKKWYLWFAFIGLAASVIFRILGHFGFTWRGIMERAFWAYFDVAFLLAFVLLGIFLYWPSKTKGNNITRVECQKDIKSIKKSISEINKTLSISKLSISKQEFDVKNRGERNGKRTKITKTKKNRKA
jgi:H+/Cl- antiporter ClcA